MSPVSPITWCRTGRSSVRRIAEADRAALAALAESPKWREVAGGTRPHSALRDGDGASGPIRVIVEVDAQISGRAVVQTGRLDVALGRHPWDRLSGVPKLGQHDDPPCPTLLVQRLGWCESRGDVRSIGANIADGLLLLCQELGARRLVIPVPLRSAHHRHLERFGPAAYLQQVHFHAVEPRTLTLFVDRNFELRGWFESESDSRREPPEADVCAVLEWENSRV